MELIQKLVSCCIQKKVHPHDVVIRHCGVCFEEGATVRKCCNCLFCDHCYTKNKMCPNCKFSTRKDDMTGATYTVQSFSEHEECRTCLEPGTKRRCCNNYYCDECYYQQPQCRSCGATINNLGLKKMFFGNTSLTSVALGWGFAVFVILAIFALVSVISASEALTPVGIYGNKCYGFFKECTTNLCIDMPQGVAHGTEPLPDLTSWRFCTLNSSVKLQTTACVFDEQLYGLTDSRAGYDPCVKEYRKGVYIMEDTFEHWEPGTLDFTTNAMASALWDDIHNGVASGRCGGGHDSDNALTFSGNVERYANTKSMDTRRGGWLEADIKFAPQGYDISHKECKTAYSGGIDIMYSTNEGATWVDWHHYDAWERRNVKFFHVELELPVEAQTASTRFRFQQEFFSSSRDAWALDNVKVYRYLPDDWSVSAAFKAVYKQTMSSVQRWQCCFDSDWCKKRMSLAEQKRCFDIPYYNGKIFLLRGAELYVCLCVVLNVIKFCYVCHYDWFIRKRIPFHEEYELLTKWDRVMKMLPARYRPKKSLSSTVGDIHKSARMAEELRAQLEDKEDVLALGTEAIKKRKDVLIQERLAKMKAIKKERKRLKARMAKRGYTGPGLESLEKLEPLEEEEDIEKAQEQTNFKETKIASDEDRLKRGKIALLRIPFDVKNNWAFRQYFAITVATIFGVVLMYRISTTTYYEVYNDLKLWGSVQSSVTLTSFGINFFAFLCDLKEMYYVLKHVVPIVDSMIPMVTVDLSADINSLFVGTYQVPLTNISEFNNFSVYFMWGCTACFFIGSWPWCLMSLLLRNEFLPYERMRVVSPVFGAIICWRAILGPAFLLKCAFSMFYFFDFETVAREKVGKAINSERSQLSANTTMGAFAIAAFIIGLTFFYSIAGIIFGCALVAGYVYGTCTGCMHSLPIKPWMYLTTPEPGMWLRVKKKQRCPCIYWGSFCTEIHLSDEVLIVYPVDDVKFRYVLQGNVESTAK